MTRRGVMVAVSPLQLISAFEFLALEAAPAGEYHVIICMDTVNGRSKNLPQVEAILKAYDAPVQVHWALWPKATRKWLPHLKLARKRKLAVAACTIGPADWLFLGSFKRHYLGLCRRLRPSDLIISDDGTCLLRKTASEGFRRKIDRFVERAALGTQLRARYFTCFQSENLKLPVIENDFRWLAKMASNAEVVDEVHIVGSAFTSRREYSEEIYLQALVRMVDLAKTQGDTIVYLPHRWESDEQLDSIRKQFLGAFEIRRNHMPIELAYAVSNKVPRHICGFSSTALVTLPKVLRNKPIRFTACQIDFSRSRMSDETIKGYRVLYDLIADTIGKNSVFFFGTPSGKA
jgi:hypothetical protein